MEKIYFILSFKHMHIDFHSMEEHFSNVHFIRVICLFGCVFSRYF